MTMVNLQITDKEHDEIKAAAELFHTTVDEFVSRSALWVMYNCAEIASDNPPGVEKLAEVWYNRA